MPSNNSKYSQQMREDTAKFIIENNKSATSVAEEKGIFQAKSLEESEQKYRIKELEMKLKKKEKELVEEREKVEILKKSLRIFMQPHE